MNETSGTDSISVRVGARVTVLCWQEAAVIVGSAREAADLLGPRFAQAEGEKLVILHLDGERRVIAVAEQPAEFEETVLLPMRTIFAEALKLGSAGLVIAHNHPGGDPQPSQADIDATRRIAETAASLGIRLHDHLVFAGDDCLSFRDLGLL